MFDENGFDITKSAEEVGLGLSLWDVLVIHGHLCLALRHPELHGEASKRAKEIVTQLETILVDAGVINETALRRIRHVETEARRGTP